MVKRSLVARRLPTLSEVDCLTPELAMLQSTRQRQHFPVHSAMLLQSASKYCLVPNNRSNRRSNLCCNNHNHYRKHRHHNYYHERKGTRRSWRRTTSASLDCTTSATSIGGSNNTAGKCKQCRITCTSRLHQ